MYRRGHRSAGWTCGQTGGQHEAHGVSHNTLAETGDATVSKVALFSIASVRNSCCGTPTP